MESPSRPERQNYILPFTEETDGCYMHTKNGVKIFEIINEEKPHHPGCRNGYTLDVNRDLADFWFKDGKIILQLHGSKEQIQIHFTEGRLHVLAPKDCKLSPELPVAIKAINLEKGLVSMRADNVLAFTGNSETRYS